MIDLLCLLAQDNTNAPQGGDPFTRLLLPLILAMGVAWFIMSRGRSKERQKFEDMLNNLKRNDRVQTVGGIYGAVWEVKDGEVVLKVDESNNIKLRFNRNAIKEVITAEGPVEKKQ